MALMINTNVSSLNAQRQLMSSGADLNQASERLASGQRINSAADDARLTGKIFSTVHWVN